MQKRSDHIIKKQSVAIEFRDRQEGMGLQNSIADLVKERIIPQLDELFSEIAGEGKYLSLDELLIDAGTLNSAHWEEELVTNTIRQVKEKLRTGSAYNINPEITVHDVIQAGTMSTWEAFIHFLELGYMPWYAANIPLAEMEQSILIHVKQSSDSITALRQKLYAEKNMLLRFMLQFSASFTGALIDSIAVDQQSTKAAAQFIYSLDRIAADTQHRLVLLFRLFYAGITGQINELQSTALKEAMEVNATPSIYRLIKKALVPVRVLVPARLLVQLAEEALRSDKEKITATIDSLFETVIPVIPAKKNSRSEVPAETVAKSMQAKPANIASPQKESSTAQNNELLNEEKDQGIFISNAGLVLLHPFLTGLFSALKLTDEHNQWLQPAFHARAVLVTQYLVTCLEEADEHVLVLNKLLCGYPADATLEKSLTLTDEEKSEIASLLQTVIQYWEALKNTSIEGLRNTFLLRDGKLTGNENGWLLQIEQKAWDVLLDTLPWGTSMIKTPWMTELLRVQWG